MIDATDEQVRGREMIRTFMQVVDAKLTEAAALARSASAFDTAGLSDRAFHALLDVEPLIHDATMLLNAASVLRRHERREPPFT